MTDWVVQRIWWVPSNQAKQSYIFTWECERHLLCSGVCRRTVIVLTMFEHIVGPYTFLLNTHKHNDSLMAKTCFYHQCSQYTECTNKESKGGLCFKSGLRSFYGDVGETCYHWCKVTAASVLWEGASYKLHYKHHLSSIECFRLL